MNALQIIVYMYIGPKFQRADQIFRISIYFENKTDTFDGKRKPRVKERKRNDAFKCSQRIKLFYVKQYCMPVAF